MTDLRTYAEAEEAHGEGGGNAKYPGSVVTISKTPDGKAYVSNRYFRDGEKEILIEEFKP